MAKSPGSIFLIGSTGAYAVTAFIAWRYATLNHTRVTPQMSLVISFSNLQIILLFYGLGWLADLLRKWMGDPPMDTQSKLTRKYWRRTLGIALLAVAFVNAVAQVGLVIS